MMDGMPGPIILPSLEAEEEILPHHMTVPSRDLAFTCQNSDSFAPTAFLGSNDVSPPPPH